MDSINSWIDEDEVRKLAGDLTATPEEVEKWRAEDFDGFAIAEKQGKGNAREVEKDLREEEVEAGLAQEVKDIKSISLAGASAMAASAGLLGPSKKNSEIKEIHITKEVESVKQAAKELRAAVNLIESNEGSLPPLCDHCLNEVPVNVDDRVKATLPSVNPDKELGTFEEIDKGLTKTVKANGICVIDRDGDVLYSSMKNQSLVAFTVDAMLGTKLLQIEDGESGNIRIKVGAGDYLEFVSVKSTRGVLILAASMNQAMGNKNSQIVADDILKIANKT